MGQTHVVSKVSAEIVEPKKNKPSEGFLVFKVDLSMMGEEDGKDHQQVRQYGNEISKLLERIIKETKAVDVESLCLITGKRVWSLNIDICMINNDGNLIDCIYLSVMTSLLHFRKPYVTIESQEKIKIYSEVEKNPQPLSIHHIPIAFTFCLFHNGRVVVCDPLRLEEQIMDGRITITMNIYKDICNIHKPGGAPIDPSILSIMIQTASLKVTQMTKFIREILQQTAQNSLEQIKQENKIIEMQFPSFDDYASFQQNQGNENTMELEEKYNQQLQSQNQQDQSQKIDIEEVEKQLNERNNN
ncbi:Ribosomal protein S5 domain 2-type fold [Pseudocohnilembus persalinus]|uniref:Ribosomal protein S5 domain 2-type fold n=1 Tax=Pseudocohnilembus persalinus TaxID=266149 RepID=A0A0V0QEJ3_PSEPJ|nr:Ribosomal protein S5 domain 2-type fold [Pseudocohnilembus persalinus]|eukprot:KRX00598.1 Ribosomal protein S5 domain 2-type fold [Pseudocohnilembus persalinus]